MNLPGLAGRKISIPASLRHNLGLKIISLIAAVVIWTAVRMQTDPVVERQISMRVSTTAAPEGMQVLSIEPSEMDITLRGRESLLDADTPQPARVVADIRLAQVGSQTVKVAVTPLRAGVELVDKSRDHVQIEIDTVISEARAVQVQLRGRPAEGFSGRSWQVQPNEVKVRGPAARVKRVVEVLAVIDISEASATVKRDVVSQARDENNLPVDGVEIEPAKATVTVSIEWVNTKTVPISPVIGTPPQGWILSAVEVSPTSVTIAGSGQALAAVDAIKTARVDVSDLRATSAYSVPLDLPSGVQALGAASARVTVTLSRMRSNRSSSTNTGGAGASNATNGASGLEPDEPDGNTNGQGGIERKPDEPRDDGTDTPAPSRPGPDDSGTDNGAPVTDPETPAGGGNTTKPPATPRTTAPGAVGTQPDGAE